MKQSLLLLLSLFQIATFAQSIDGKIYSSDKTPLPEVYIQINKSERHAHTNHLGYFSISDCKTGDTLNISHIGFESQQVLISAKTFDVELSITLSESTLALSEVRVSPKLDANNIFTKVNLETNPVNSSQDILRVVPGIIIGQHAGGGKAEQIFLRGFDIDHGTDLSINVDGMPVNMVSHAHGQGYSDLHFIIPETVEGVNFGKGPYAAEYGNFATAGYVDLQTKERLKNNLIKVEAGMFNTQRLMGMMNILDQNPKHSAYIATELQLTDGPFESSQNFSRINIFGNYTGHLNGGDKLSFKASHFSSQWDASGQIPQRAINDGSITRWGAIDDTEGGNTSRTNLQFQYTKLISKKAFVKTSAYYSKYFFELYSNFTFFLEDSINGDQIKQMESRDLMGLTSEFNSSYQLGSYNGTFKMAIGLRNDKSTDNELTHTKNRQETLIPIQLGDVFETNLFTYVNTTITTGRWSFIPAIRVDNFKYNYYDKLKSSYETQAASKTIISPKLSVLFNATEDIQWFLKGGKGFHSNDTRVIISQRGNQILPAAYSADLGFIWKPIDNVIISSAAWYLYLEQEFVYVGDAGIVEPSGRTNRKGIDLSIRHQPFVWFFWDADATYTYARSIDEPENANYIPLAPDFTLSLGANLKLKNGLYSGLRMRHIDDRPANEDNTIVAQGYTVFDYNIGFEKNSYNFGITIQNLFNTNWNETQFATESRLINETQPIEEIHFTPGSPFFLKAFIGFKF